MKQTKNVGALRALFFRFLMIKKQELEFLLSPSSLHPQGDVTLSPPRPKVCPLTHTYTHGPRRIYNHGVEGIQHHRCRPYHLMEKVQVAHFPYRSSFDSVQSLVHSVCAMLTQSFRSLDCQAVMMVPKVYSWPVWSEKLTFPTGPSQVITM